MPVGGTEFFGEFQSEHNLSQDLFKGDRANILRSIGFERDQASNRRALFTSQDIVGQLESDPATAEYRALLRKAGWGTVLHRGGDTSVGGFQEAKTEFQRRLVDNWIERFLDADDPRHISQDSLRRSVDMLSRFSDNVSQGLVIDPDTGRPLGVMGADYTPEKYQRAWQQFSENFDPSMLESGTPEATRLAAELDTYHNARDTTLWNDDVARYNHVDRAIREARAAGKITAEQFNEQLRKLGTAKTNGARVRNAGILAYRDISSAYQSNIGKIAEFARRALAEGRAIGEIAHGATVSALETIVGEKIRLVDIEAANASRLPARLSDYGVQTARAMHRTAVRLGTRASAAADAINSNQWISGYKGVALGLGIGYADTVYDSVKKGWNTGDWSDFWIESAKWGAVTAGAFAAVAVVTAVVAGTAAAPFVAAGLAIAGLVGGAIALADLAGKVINDIFGIESTPLADGAVTNPETMFNNNTGERILYDWITGQLGSRTYLQSLEILYQADDQSDEFPDDVLGTDKSELFYAFNGARVDGSSGDDEIYHVGGYGTASGGEGSDIVLGLNGRVLSAGSVLYPWMNEYADERIRENQRIAAENAERAELGLTLLEVLPTLPRSPLAEEDITLKLDGGADNDIVFALGGERVTTLGGTGRDWVYNRSKNGIIYGDTESGTYETPRLGPDGQPLYNEQGYPLTDTVPVEDVSANSDNIWFYADTTLMDAQHHDLLKYFGIPLTGGDANGGVAGFAIMNGLFGAAIGMGNILRYISGTAQDWTDEVYIDHIQPWMIYTFQRDEDGNLDMYITNAFEQIFSGMMAALGQEAPDSPDSIHKGWMKIENVDVVGSRLGILQAAAGEQVLNGVKGGDLGMVFRAVNPLQALLPVLNLVPGLIGAALYYTVLADALISTVEAMKRFTKAMKWADGADPLVIDLDGDGIETTSLDQSRAYFDVDGDMFRERTGWLRGDDGFLVLDSNGNGRVDGIAELFGDRAQGGFAELAAYDSNGDGKITVADIIWGELRVWQDRDRDGETDAGELKSLDSLGIVSLSLGATPLNVTTPQNARLLSSADVGFANGRTTRMFEAIFTANEVDTKFAGEAGFAPWQASDVLNAKGFGTVTDLAVAAANDPEFAELVQARAAAMTVPKIKTLVAQAGDVLGGWGMTLETSRELVAVRLDGTGAMLDRAIYVEDQAGGYWTLRSGAPVLDGAGTAVARPTLEQVLAQGGGWRLEQAWSPASRGEALTKRDEAPYLMRLQGGRAIILDYGVKLADGRWALASAPGTAYASVEAILALPHAAGTEWRREDLQFNPLADLPVEAIGVRFTDGKVVDYTVQVTDRDGTFYVWARNLDRALELEWKTGDYREFNLRNYEVDFDSLDEVGSTDDSTYRVELLTPAQFHFAMSLGGAAFHPEMLSAVANDVTGHLAYSVNDSGSASLAPDSYVSSIKTMISLLQPAMEQYVIVSRRFAVRMALQGGLSEFARGIDYDASRDVFTATTDRQMAPMFEAIFEAAPASNANDAVLDYLTDWNELLWQIYPDFAPADGGVLNAKVGIDQAYIMQMLIQAYENVGVDLDIRGVAHALSVDETRIRTHLASDTQVAGTDGTDFFYMTGGNQTVTGGMSADYYFVGKNSGDDYINDKDLGGDDELRFTDVKSDDVKAIRDGQDLILQIRGRTNFIRLTDQFLGELNEYATNGKQFESGVDSIIFSDGVVWDRFRMALEVVDYERAEGLFNDPLTGSGSADVLMGGKGNDFLSGNVGGDIYVFRRGDGQDVINDLGGFSFGPIKAGLDFLQFRGDITAKDLYLIRDGASENLKLYIRDANGQINRDANGQITNDGIEIVGQFGGVRLNFGLFAEALGSSDGLDYIAPNLIEKFILGDNTSLDFSEIVRQVLENAKTDGDDAIYGLLNDNTLDGGKGDDYLTGREGTDTYKFGRNYGQDVVEDADYSLALFGPKDDFLQFTDDLRWTDFDFLREGKSDTLTLQVKGTTDQLILTEYLKEVFLVGYVNLLETITFADGTKWSYLKLLQHYVDIAKTDGNDTIYGFEGISDSIDGGLGNDRLEGLSGNDRYVYGRNYGNDTILDDSGEERIQFNGIASTEITFSRTALDLIMTVTATGERIVLENQYVRDDQQHFAVEYFEFSDRTLVFTDFNPEDMDLVGTNAGEEITGSNFAETLDGRGGNDTLIGGDGGDTYKFDVGYGQDVIVDRRIRASWGDRPRAHVRVDDVVEFGDDITRANVVFTKDGDDLVISVRDRTDTLRIRNQFRGIDDGIERFEFKDDGSFLLISDVE
ncbi:MAG: calcium-binding protein, partial [Allosphingosinicella sp.]